MSLPIQAPYPPMEALAATSLPEGPDWHYEPKWDGFRCIVFRDAGSLDLRSKAGLPLARYFPDLVPPFSSLKGPRFVLDGEIVIAIRNRISFEQLQLRLHPAASRVNKLAKEHPAMFLVFDILVDDRGNSLVDKPLIERRRKLEAFAAKCLEGEKSIRLSPATGRLQTAKKWLEDMGGGLDGIIAKRLDCPYESGQRTGAMLKIKNLRSADCVVGGFRYATKGKVVGSLLLGLYGEDGLLHHVGYTSAIPADDKAALTKKLEKLVSPPGFTGSAPGAPSRWSTERSTVWEPLETQLVVEVQYDHFTGGRFRHGTKLLRWRPDKDPAQCTSAQVEHESRSPLSLL
jgi:ATP-dependent DNA ligase